LDETSPPLRGRQQRRPTSHTYASFLNRIESHFGAIGEVVCKNADYVADGLGRV
jgi:hypothetical protein